MDSAGKQVQTPLFEGILRRNPVDQDRARERLRAARTEVQILLWDIEAAGQQDRTAENETGDRADRAQPLNAEGVDLSLIHISEPTRRTPISYAVFCLK